jgi:hypothetical protein
VKRLILLTSNNNINNTEVLASLGMQSAEGAELTVQPCASNSNNDNTRTTPDHGNQYAEIAAAAATTQPRCFGRRSLVEFERGLLRLSFLLSLRNAYNKLLLRRVA